ncbi:MAG TPA: TlpA disulfide reductase family protein [Burkholderiaceae bacterium]|nr:TlpA disulfide reductase family protein [Burkholderiaceae bacterium]
MTHRISKASTRSWRTALALLMAGAGALAVATPLAPSSPAPDFTLRALDGQKLRLGEQRGRVVLVNFWATWCGPCRQEMPHLNKLYEKYRSSGFVLLGVNVDDDTAQAAGVASKLGVTFPVLPDADKRVSRQYDLSAMPSTVLIDRDGRVRYLHRGYQNGYENTYDKQIRELLKE